MPCRARPLKQNRILGPPGCRSALATFSSRSRAGARVGIHGHAYAGGLAATASWESTTLGNRIVNVEPLPGSLATVMSPPIILQKRRNPTSGWPKALRAVFRGRHNNC